MESSRSSPVGSGDRRSAGSIQKRSDDCYPRADDCRPDHFARSAEPWPIPVSLRSQWAIFPRMGNAANKRIQSWTGSRRLLRSCRTEQELAFRFCKKRKGYLQFRLVLCLRHVGRVPLDLFAAPQELVASQAAFVRRPILPARRVVIEESLTICLPFTRHCRTSLQSSGSACPR